MNDNRPFSRYPVPELAGLPTDIRTMLEEVQDKTGFIPNVFMALAHRPDELRAFVAYHDALMKRDSSLTKAEREMIAVCVSVENHCFYCLVAHGATLRQLTGDPILSEAIAANYRQASLDDRQRAMLDFATKVTRASYDIDEADRQILRDAGFSNRAIWDIAETAAFFNMSNRMASAVGMKPNDEYHGMAR